MSEPKHSAYCRKEGEIAEIHADLNTLKKIVMGNGQEGLAMSVPKLSQNVNELSSSAKDLRTAVSGLLKFQEGMQGEQKGKSELRKRNRWIIGILITALIGVAGLLFYLFEIIKDMQV